MSKLYMTVERFKNGGAPVYRRFREKGRMAPEGLNCVSSKEAEEKVARSGR